MFGFKSEPSNRPLRILIVGAGKVGVTLVDQLSKEGNDIAIIDNNPDKIDEINNQYDVLAINGNGANTSILKEAGIMETDLFIAVTESDELNLLCCTVASMVSHRDLSTIARVRTPDYSQDAAYLRDKLGLAMIINPALETSNEIARILKEEGFINDYKVEGRTLTVKLKYADKKQRVITGLKRISKPGLRVYAKGEELPRVLNGLGIAIISTSKGIMTDKEARKQNIGGEVLAYIW